MRKFTSVLLAGAVALSALATVAYAENPMVGGAPMYADKNIVENAVNSKDHTTLVAAVKAAGLVETLQGAGPFTVFAPINAAFDALPAGTVDTLLKPENKDQLDQDPDLPRRRRRRRCRPTSARWSRTTAARTRSRPSAAASCTPRSTATRSRVTDENGNVANVTIADVEQSNGVIHVIDKVLLPKM